MEQIQETYLPKSQSSNLFTVLQNFYREYSQSTNKPTSKDQLWNKFYTFCIQFPKQSLQITGSASKYDEAYKNPFLALFFTINSQAFKQKQRTETCHQSLTKLDAHFKKPVEELAKYLQSRHKLDVSLGILREYCDNCPQDKDMLRALCQNYQLGKQWKKAADSYEKLIKLEPSKGYFYFKFAECQLKCIEKQRLEKCERYINKGMELCRQCEYMFSCCKGKILCQRQRLEEGFSLLFRSINLNRLYTESYVYLAKLYIATHRANEIIELLKYCLEINPQQKRVHGYLAAAYRQNNQIDKFLQTANKLAAMHSQKTPIFNYAIGQALFFEGKIEKAIEYYQFWDSYHSLFTLKANVGFRLSCLYEQLGDIKTALKYCEMQQQREQYFNFSNNLQLTRLCFKAGRISQCERTLNTLMAQAEYQLQFSAQFLQLLYDIERYEECLRFYQRQMICSKATLMFCELLKIEIIVFKCYEITGNTDAMLEMYHQINALLKSQHQNCEFSDLLDFVEIKISFEELEEAEKLLVNIRRDLQRADKIEQTEYQQRIGQQQAKIDQLRQQASELAQQTPKGNH